MSNPSVELAALMPWTAAKPDSMWDVSGSTTEGTFTNCLARVLPTFVTGTESPLFEVLMYGGSYFVRASAITKATELVLVRADNPSEAYYERDQATIEGA